MTGTAVVTVFKPRIPNMMGWDKCRTVVINFLLIHSLKFVVILGIDSEEGLKPRTWGPFTLVLKQY